MFNCLSEEKSKKRMRMQSYTLPELHEFAISLLDIVISMEVYQSVWL